MATKRIGRLDREKDEERKMEMEEGLVLEPAEGIAD